MNALAPAAELSAAIADVADHADRDDGDLAAEMELVRDAGWLAACLPAEHGGCGWGTQAPAALEAFDALRRLGRANLSVARLFEGHMNAVKLIMLFASRRLQHETARLVGEGCLLGVWGADVPDRPVRFEQTGDRLVLHGAKRFASGLGLVARALITAPIDARPQLLLVRADDPARAEVSGWRMSGMRATRSGTYDFEGLAIPAGCRVGEPGDMLREPWFEGGIWRYCAAHLGAAETLFREMCAELEARGRHEECNQQRRIAEGAVAIETMRLWLTRCASAVEAEDAAAREAAISLFAREVTATACREVIALVEQALGMAAFVEGTRIERMRRDLEVFLCQAGPDAKRESATRTLLAHGALVEEL